MVLPSADAGLSAAQAAQRIAGAEVVRGDILLLAEGDRIAADAVLISGPELQVDESLLTGEAVPVNKVASVAPLPSAGARPGGDQLPYLYSGTLVGVAGAAGRQLCLHPARGAFGAAHL